MFNTSYLEADEKRKIEALGLREVITFTIGQIKEKQTDMIYNLKGSLVFCGICNQ